MLLFYKTILFHFISYKHKQQQCLNLRWHLGQIFNNKISNYITIKVFCSVCLCTAVHCECIFTGVKETPTGGKCSVCVCLIDKRQGQSGEGLWVRGHDLKHTWTEHPPPLRTSGCTIKHVLSVLAQNKWCRPVKPQSCTYCTLMSRGRGQPLCNSSLCASVWRRSIFGSGASKR